MSCTCEKIPVGKGKGSVQGYSVSTLCSECQAQQVLDAEAAVEQKKYDDANQLVAERSYKIAEDELIAEGVIEKKDGKVKIK